jgi:hypothetical protein
MLEDEMAWLWVTTLKTSDTQQQNQRPQTKQLRGPKNRQKYNLFAFSLLQLAEGNAQFLDRD